MQNHDWFILLKDEHKYPTENDEASRKIQSYTDWAQEKKKYIEKSFLTLITLITFCQWSTLEVL